jgi:hypothetical protein
VALIGALLGAAILVLTLSKDKPAPESPDRIPAAQTVSAPLPELLQVQPPATSDRPLVAPAVAEPAATEAPAATAEPPLPTLSASAAPASAAAPKPKTRSIAHKSTPAPAAQTTSAPAPATAPPAPRPTRDPLGGRH